MLDAAPLACIQISHCIELCHGCSAKFHLKTKTHLVHGAQETQHTQNGLKSSKSTKRFLLLMPPRPGPSLLWLSKDLVEPQNDLLRGNKSLSYLCASLCKVSHEGTPPSLASISIMSTPLPYRETELCPRNSPQCISLDRKGDDNPIMNFFDKSESMLGLVLKARWMVYHHAFER